MWGEFKKIITEIIVQVLEMVLILFMIGGGWTYLFRPELFQAIIMLLGVMAPLAFIFAIYALLTIKKIKRFRKEAEEDETFYEYFEIVVSRKDELKNDALALIAASSIIVIAKMINGHFDYADVWQAGIVFLAVYGTKEIYFKEHHWFGKIKDKSFKEKF